jgi:hypothetical protein
MAQDRPHRVVVELPVPAVVGGLVGQPRRSGLCWDLGVSRRCEVYERALKRALSIPVSEVNAR